MSTFETVEFSAAEDFVAALRPSLRTWTPHGAWQPEWIFRGQADSDWTLTPSAWRHYAATHPAYIVASNLGDNTREASVILRERRETTFQLSDDEWLSRVFKIVVQRKFELLVASGFGEVMDNLGHAVPGTYDSLQPSWDYLDGPGLWNECTPDEINPSQLHVIAQHHGCPTRLLDFTGNPLAAAFFAADTDCAAERLAVWCLKRGSNKLSGEDFHYNWGGRCNPGVGWRVIAYPRAASPFLHAQSGLFAVFDRAASHYYEHGAWPNLEETVPPQNLKRLTLPRSEVPELTRLLWIEGISRAHLMPTLDSISTSLNRVWQHDTTFRRRALESLGPVPLADKSNTDETPIP